MDRSANLDLPFIAAAQAQKHVTHNEALIMLDALVQLVVDSAALTEPPAVSANGARYIVPAGASGAFAGKEGQIAHYRDGAFAFYQPAPGWRAFDLAGNMALVWTGSDWQTEPAPVPSELQNLSFLGIGTSADAGNPFSAKLNSALWTANETEEGGNGDLRYVFNKEGASNTASILFQSGYSGRAEIGLTGSEQLRVKVSPDGSAWTEALVIEGGGKMGLGVWPTHRLTVDGAIGHGSDNAFAFGSASLRASVVYAATGVINTSDAREKMDIRPSELGIDFLRALRPVSYRWREAGDGSGRPGARRHHGLIAQEVKAALDVIGTADFAGFVLADPSDPESRQGLRYDQFIAPLIAAVQALDARISALEAGGAGAA